MRKLSSLLLFFLCVSLLPGCQGMRESDSQKMRSDDGLQVIGDYRIWKDNLDSYIIFKDTEARPSIIEGDITKWGKTETIIYGYQTAFRFPSSSIYSTTEGYFYFNTEDKSTSEGMTLKGLSDYLGISEDNIEKSLNVIEKSS